MTVNNSNFRQNAKGVFLPIPAHEVKKFHENSDVDHDRNSQHHTLGTGPNEAAAGNHEHAKGPGIRGTLAGDQGIATLFWSRVTNVTTTHWLGPVEEGITFIGGGQWVIDDPGWYEFKFNFAFAAGGAGARFGAVAKNGARVLAQGFNPVVYNAGGFVAGELVIATGDIVDFMVFQDSGATKALTAEENNSRTNYAIRKVSGI